MFRFLPGLVLVQLLTLALAWASLGAPLAEVALRLGVPALIVAATAAFWFGQLGRLGAERELARTRLEHAEERERLKRDALVEAERLKLDARAESDRVRLDAEREKAAVVEAARRESRAEERRIDRRANARVALAFAGAAAAGAVMLMTPLVTLGLVTIAATGGGLGGYALRWRQTRARTGRVAGATLGDGRDGEAVPGAPDGTVAGAKGAPALPAPVVGVGGTPRRRGPRRAGAGGAA